MTGVDSRRELRALVVSGRSPRCAGEMPRSGKGGRGCQPDVPPARDSLPLPLRLPRDAYEKAGSSALPRSLLLGGDDGSRVVQYLSAFRECFNIPIRDFIHVSDSLPLRRDLSAGILTNAKKPGHSGRTFALVEMTGVDSRRELRALVGRGSRVPQARDSLPLPLRLPKDAYEKAGSSALPRSLLLVSLGQNRCTIIYLIFQSHEPSL